MADSYTHRLHLRAIKDTRHVLRIESGERAVIGTILVVIAIGLIWWIGGREIAGGEIIVQLALTAAIILAFPFVYLWKFVTAPAKMQAEADSKIEQLSQTRAKLTIDGPLLHRDDRYKSQSRWRMTVHNHGPATAENVQMKLCNIEPRPKNPNWQADYPYVVVRVGSTADAPDHHINPNDYAKYEIICGWKAENAGFFTNLDTRTSAPIGIEPDERLRLSYNLTAKNAEPLSFALQMFIEGDEVKVVGIK